MRWSFKPARRLLWAAIASAVLPLALFAQSPYGLDTRPAIGPYLNSVMPPKNGAFAFPPVLSATGAFKDLQTLTPADGLIPFAPNSPLWTDGAMKTRWMAVPNDGAPYGAGEQIGFAAAGEWSFPNGTVFVKQFDLIVNEATGERKRQETRLLVRDAEGAVYGVTYKWRADHSDADLLADGLEEDVAITDAAGAVRIQRYSYPSRADCLFCHNRVANFVLGAKTHQLNGDHTYPATGRTDNQLRTFKHLGMLNPEPDETSFATYLRSVAVDAPNATVQHRMRSWIDANCSHCHRPGGFGPGYDGRFYTPLEQQNLIDNYVRFRALDGSQLYQRDNALDEFKMPPIAKNVIHETAMATLRQWIASPLEVLSVHLAADANHLAVRFNSYVDRATVIASNFALDEGAIVSAAEIGREPDVVILAVSSLEQGRVYTLTTSNVQDTAQSANTIWPRSRKPFVAEYAVAPATARLANISTRVRVGGGERVLVGGFIARGGATKRLMVRAIGPSLSSAGVGGALADPALELFDSSGVRIAENDNWQENANRQEIVDTGLAPSLPNESAMVVTLPSSASGIAYTVVVRAADGAAGVGLVELYDLDRTAGSQFANISSRGGVAGGENVMIAGFIIGPGTDGGGARVAVRAIGPALALSGVAEPLRDPRLTLYDANGAEIAGNDDWKGDPDQPSQQDGIQAAGLAPASEAESALIVELPAGNYTAITSGKDGNTGVALVEVYHLR